MKLIESDILPIAEKTGFRIEMIEKVLLLINLLNTLNSHPFLKGKWVLKGGTVLDLFLLKSDKTLISQIKKQPFLEWKALNVKQYKKK